MLGEWRKYRHLFPIQLERSRFERRRKIKKRTIFGYRLQLLVTLGGCILDCELTSANTDDRGSARDLGFDKRDLTVPPGVTTCTTTDQSSPPNRRNGEWTTD